MGSEDDSTQLVQRLVIKLLKGCSNTFTKNITEDVSFQKSVLFQDRANIVEKALLSVCIM